MKKLIVVIPARMASSRYPGKPLAKILDLPMLEHVRRRSVLAAGVDEVAVATCDQEIMDYVHSVGGKAVMTADTHERCSERVGEAMRSLTGDVVVGVQGDEPLLFPEAIQQTAEPLLTRDDVLCVSMLSPLEGDADYTTSSIVKAACDQRGRVLYLSRAPIPYFMKPGAPPVYRETGIRAFRADFLQTYCSLPETPLERIEAVDMLRVLEHGYWIQGVVTKYATMGVDYVEEIAKVEGILRTDPVQRALYERIARGA